MAKINSMNLNVEGVGACEFKPVPEHGSWLGVVDGRLYMTAMETNGMPEIDNIYTPSKISFNSELQMMAWLEITNEALGTELGRDSIED